MEQDWLRIDIFTSTEGLDHVGAALSDIGHHSYEIVDASDLDGLIDGKYGVWDYIDDGLEMMRETETTITVYIPCNEESQKNLDAIYVMLERLKASDSAGKMGRLVCNTSSMRDENWATAWREHFKPIAIGERLMICPPWVECDPGGRKVLYIDPGMAFGTGIDETTRMCLEALECAVEDGCAILDVGCGSGILAIGALLLGAGFAQGVDADQVAVESAGENARLSGVSDRAVFACGNLADGVEGTFDVVCANLAADALLTLIPGIPRVLKPGGLFILSGIIIDREQDIMDALAGEGFTIRGRREDGSWVCVVAV